MLNCYKNKKLSKNNIFYIDLKNCYIYLKFIFYIFILLLLRNIAIMFASQFFWLTLIF